MVRRLRNEMREGMGMVENWMGRGRGTGVNRRRKKGRENSEGKGKRRDGRKGCTDGVPCLFNIQVLEPTDIIYIYDSLYSP